MQKDKRTFYNAGARVTYAFGRVGKGTAGCGKTRVPRENREGTSLLVPSGRLFLLVERASARRSLLSEVFRNLFIVLSGRHKTEPSLSCKIKNFVKEITVAELPISQLVVACSPAGFAIHQSIGAETHVDLRLAQDAELLALAL